MPLTVIHSFTFIFSPVSCFSLVFYTENNSFTTGIKSKPTLSGHRIGISSTRSHTLMKDCILSCHIWNLHPKCNCKFTIRIMILQSFFRNRQNWIILLVALEVCCKSTFSTFSGKARLRIIYTGTSSCRKFLRIQLIWTCIFIITIEWQIQY